jgi:hypothetical protein
LHDDDDDDDDDYVLSVGTNKLGGRVGNGSGRVSPNVTEPIER